MLSPISLVNMYKLFISSTKCLVEPRPTFRTLNSFYTRGQRWKWERENHWICSVHVVLGWFKSSESESCSCGHAFVCVCVCLSLHEFVFSRSVCLVWERWINMPNITAAVLTHLPLRVSACVCFGECAVGVFFSLARLAHFWQRSHVSWCRNRLGPIFKSPFPP